MANYSTLKSEINSKVFENDEQQISGENLNIVLNKMVELLGYGYQFGGMASKNIAPRITDAKVFYIALEKGVYTFLGQSEVKNPSFITHSDTWHVFPIYDGQMFNDLGEVSDNWWESLAEYPEGAYTFTNMDGDKAYVIKDETDEGGNFTFIYKDSVERDAIFLGEFTDGDYITRRIVTEDILSNYATKQYVDDLIEELRQSR